MADEIKRKATGFKAQNGDMIFDGDIVEFMLDGEKTTDLVHWMEDDWRLGSYDGSLSHYKIEKVVGNKNVTAWPDTLI